MKKLVLVLSLCCASVAQADAGFVDAGPVADAGAALAIEVADAGTADAGLEADAGPEVAIGETIIRPIVTSADGGTAATELENVDVGGVVAVLKETHPKSWKWLFGIAAALVVLTTALRRFGGAFIPFLKTDRGGALLVVVVGLLGGVVNGLAAGNAADGAVWGAMVAFMSAGGYSVLKKLLFPADKS